MQQVIDFIMAHQAVVAASVVGVLDLVFALMPKVEGNGILHSIYLFLKDIADKKKQQPPAA